MRRRRDYAFVVVLVAFLCIFRSIDSEGNRKLADNFLERDNKSSWNLHHIDDETAENLWIHCWNRLKERTGIVEGLEFYRFDEVSRTTGNTKLDRYLYVRVIIQKVISDLPSPEQKFISECLRKEISQLDRLSGYGTVFSRLQENLSDWFTIPRRFLRHRKHHRRIIRPVTGPAPAPAPASASAPSRGTSVAFSPNPAPMPSYQVPASSPAPIMLPPSPVIQPPTMAPELYAPGPSVIPTSSPTPSNIPIPKVQPHRPPKIAMPTRSGNVDKDEKFIAVVSVGVVAGLGFLALFLFCLAKGRKTKVGPREDQMNGMRDGKPIFNDSSDDISADVKNFQSIGNAGSMLQNASGNGVQLPYPSGVTGAAPGNNHGSLPLPPGKSAPAPPAPPPPPPPKPPAPCPPPPPPKLVRPPPNPPKPGNKFRPSPLGPHRQDKNDEAEVSGDSGAPKPKLKPFFWEKVSANPDHSMVWHDIRAGSFQFNEEMIESLFGYSSTDKNNSDNKKDSSSYQSPPQFIRIIDAKKAQNLAILLKALNVTTEEVCDAVKEGNELPLELIHTLVKMAPTEEEEFKLRAFSGDVSLLGPAERFLKVMVDIPFAFKRLEALAFMSSFHEEVSSVVESFKTIEVACNELKNSRLFLKLLEAVLKTGNRMNVGTYRGGAQAFKLDTLLKLSDVKGTDGKTTLLLFVIQEIIRSEGVRAARRFRESESRVSESNNSLSSVKTEDLAEDSSSSSSQDTEEYHRSLGLQVVSTLSAELANVRMAAVIDGDSLASTVSSLGQSLKKSKEFMKNEMSSIEEDSDFCSTLASFLNQAEIDIAKITEDEKRIMALVKKTGDYFHGNTGRDEGLRPFVIVRDFLIMVDKACKDLKNSRKQQQQQPVRTPKKKRALTNSSSSESRPDSTSDFQQRLFPAIKQRQIEEYSFSSSSISSSSSPSAVSASSSSDEDDDKLLTLHR